MLFFKVTRSNLFIAVSIIALVYAPKARKNDSEDNGWSISDQ